MSDFDLGTKNLRLERDGPILWCTIDRPHARNALTPSMYFGIKKAVHLVNADKDLRALILTGTGDIVRAAPDEHSELFRAFPNSYGTLGYSVRLKIELDWM